MNATLIDDRRRLVMPPELPARSPVTVPQIDADTWIVKRARPVQDAHGDAAAGREGNARRPGLGEI